MMQPGFLACVSFVLLLALTSHVRAAAEGRAGELDARVRGEIVRPHATTANDGMWRDFMPPTRRGSTLAYDSTRDRFMMFGGFDQSLRNDVWSFAPDSAAWTQLAPLGRLPVPRSGSASVYDPLHDRVWMYGGIGSTGVLSGLWALDADPEEWIQLQPQDGAPSARTQAALVRDGARDRLVLYGGQLAATSLGTGASPEAWTITPFADTLRWARVTPSGAPAPRWGAIVAYDLPRDRVVILGGRNRDTVFTDAWELRFTPVPTWARLSVVTGRPPPRDGAIGVLDVAGDRIVTLGGTIAATGQAAHDIWSFDLSGTPGWTQTIITGNAPSELSEASIAFDPGRRRIVVHGGGRPQGLPASFASNETWALNLSGIPGWQRLAPAMDTPIPRYGHATAADAVGDAFWIFGGLTSLNGASVFSDEVWRARLAAPEHWTRIPASGERPEARHETLGAFDAALRRLVIFGGWNDGGGDGDRYLGDTWTMGAEPPYAWTPFATGGPGPLGRRGHAGIHDPIRRSLVIYGGLGPDSTFGDVWELSLTGTGVWRRLEPLGERPEPRYSASAIYDAGRDRMIVYGGSIAERSQPELWALSLGASPRWTRLETKDLGPGARSRHSAVYDPRRRRMVLWGGYTSDTDLIFTSYGVWALSLDGAPAWTFLGTAGREPYPATSASAVYDPRRDRMVTYGGSELFDDLLSDFRALEFGAGGVTYTAWFSGARIESDGVHLLWQTDVAPGAQVRVEKRVDVEGGGIGLPDAPPAGTWFDFGAAEITNDGSILSRDERVYPGGTYSYRVVIAGTPAGEAVIEIPGTPGFALHSLTPMPTTGTFSISLRSNGVAPLRAQLFDARGRHVETRNLGLLPAGPRILPFDLPHGRRAGVYFLRLTQGTDAITRKIVLLR